MNKVYFGHTEAIGPFDQLDFLYRVSSSRYLIDYYNGFLVSPGEQIDSMLEAKFGLLSSDVKSKNRLQIKLVELYADYRDSNNPEGVIALQFVLTGVKDDGSSKILFEKTFKEKISLQAKNSNSLMKAWSEGLQSILGKGLRFLKVKLDC